MMALNEASVSRFSRTDPSPHQKYSVLVQIELDNRISLKGHFFVSSNERISDLLNDDRQFLPFRTVEGSIRNLNKRHIIGVQEMRE